MGSKHSTFKGLYELAYLHPKYFSPNEEVLNQLNVKKADVFTVIRFVSWSAYHDLNQKGLDF